MRASRMVTVCGACTVMAALVTAGCGASPVRVTALDDLERVRTSPAASEGGAHAPEVAARAEQERQFALDSHAAGDDAAASLHAERAIAAYGHAVVVGRLAVAIAEQADAQKALEDATAQEEALDATRDGLERETAELTRRAQILRERPLPAASASTTGDREIARVAAARALAMEARLLCGAARLVSTSAQTGAQTSAPASAQTNTPDLADAEGDIARVDAKLDPPPHARTPPAPIDDAGAARARCLDVLTRARRPAGAAAGPADALLAELSAAGGWSPIRDERGVVVTLRGAFRGADLSDEGQAKLKLLGQVAAAHPGFAVQVVLHDAQPRSPADADTHRADATVKALVAAGAPPARVKAELAGVKAPLVAPTDPMRSRNDRLDVVFVAGT